MECIESYLEVEPGLNLYFRDYQSADPSLPTILCLHGLTRNGLDFLPMINELEKLDLTDQYRFVVPDMRGRGLSDYDSNPDNYTTQTYVADCWNLLNRLEIPECAIVGTSMGGIMAMQMHGDCPNRVSRILLNDIGPLIVRQGVVYVLSYLGRQMTEQSWEAAIASTKQRLTHEYPSISQEQWEEIAERSYIQREDGSWVLSYDANIRLPFLDAYEADAELDLWDTFNSIDCPLLCLRGELSRLLPRELTSAMSHQNENCEVVEVANRGHVPLLDEPEAVSAIRDWLTRARSN